MQIKTTSPAKKRKCSPCKKENDVNHVGRSRSPRVHSPSGGGSPNKKNSSPSRKKEIRNLNVSKIIEKVIEDSSKFISKRPDKNKRKKSSKSPLSEFSDKKGITSKSPSRGSLSPVPRKNKNITLKSPVKDPPSDSKLKLSVEENVANCIERVILRFTQAHQSLDDTKVAKPKKSKKNTKDTIENSLVNGFSPIDSKDVNPKRRGRPKGSKNKVKKVTVKKSPKKSPTIVKSETKHSPLKIDHKNMPIKKRLFQEIFPKEENIEIKTKTKPVKLTKSKPVKVISTRAKSKLKEKLKTAKNKTKGKLKIKQEFSENEFSDSTSPFKKSKMSFSDSDDYKNSSVNYMKKASLRGVKTVKDASDKKEKMIAGKRKKRDTDYSSASEEEQTPFKPLKKAIKEKWSREVSGSKKGSKIEDTPKKKQLALLREKKARPFYYEADDSESESEDGERYLLNDVNESKQNKKKSLKKNNKKSLNPPKRMARMASLNAIAMMACMNEDAKVSLSSSYSPTKNDSMALVLKPPSAVVRHHSETDSDSDSSLLDDKNVKRKNVFKEAKTRKRKRRGELDVMMDMKDMVVTKRMASLNASAIMAASCSLESRSRKTPQSRTSEVTNVDIKRKISYKATKNQSTKTRSVITVQETTKKVKKAQGSRETEVEEHIIVKKKVKRRSGNTTEDTDDKDDDNGTDNSELEILPKSPDSGMIVESTITYVTTQAVPQTVTMSGVSKYCITSTDGKTTTVVQQVQRKSTSTTSSVGPIPTAHIPPTQHIHVSN